MPEEPRRELRDRIDRIEESYEFMLAYAAQGLTAEQEARQSGTQLRTYLEQTDEALTGIADLITTLVEQEKPDAAEQYLAFANVLEWDARAAQAVVRLVLSQSAISSQLVDNLNASIHLRALLTDLFVIDEILSPHAGRVTPA